MADLTFIVGKNGYRRTLLEQDSDLARSILGQQVHVYRNSHVDVTEDLSGASQLILHREDRYQPQRWWADMTPVLCDVILGPFDTRDQALEAEVQCLLQNHLPLPKRPLNLPNDSSPPSRSTSG